jgi:hypothetical protein
MCINRIDKQLWLSRADNVVKWNMDFFMCYFECVWICWFIYEMTIFLDGIWTQFLIQIKYNEKPNK